MKKTNLMLVVVLALMLIFSTLAFADTPIPVPGGTICIDPVPDLALAQAQLDIGYSVYVTGYINFNASEANQGRLSSIKLEVKKADSELWEPVKTIKYSPPLESMILTMRGEDISGQEFEIPWTIHEVGSYLLRVTAGFTASSNNYADTNSTEIVDVTLIMPVNVDYPAAPAVAAIILKGNNIKPNYGKGRNYIADIAAEMGSHPEDENGSWFHGIDKSSVEEYYDAVYQYLKDLGVGLPVLP